LGESDLAQYRLLEKLRDSSDPIPAYHELMGTLSKIMLDWRIIQNCQISKILSSKGLTFDQIAFVNLIAWRTQTSAIPVNAYEAARNHHVIEQIELLNPSRVIALGVSARDWLIKGGMEKFDTADTIKRRQADPGFASRGRSYSRGYLQ
jgi:hypothetical protein